MLKINDVSKIYKSRAEEVVAVDKVCLDVKYNEMVVVRGPSGCGKTTLLLAAGGLLAPSSGDVEINGKMPYQLSASERADLRAESIGFVFQQFHLVPYLTVLENILVPTFTGRQTPNATKRAKDLVEEMGLKNRENHLPSELSTGEKQRVAVARALLNDPGLIIADEPTGNLDGENGRAVMGMLRKLADDGRAVMVVTHDESMDSYATRVIKMADGRIV